MFEWLKFWKRKKDKQRTVFGNHPEDNPDYDRLRQKRLDAEERARYLRRSSSSDVYGVYGASGYGGLNSNTHHGGSVGGGGDAGGSFGGGCDGGSSGM